MDVLGEGVGMMDQPPVTGGGRGKGLMGGGGGKKEAIFRG